LYNVEKTVDRLSTLADNRHNAPS